MTAPKANYMLITSEGNTNPGEPQGIKIYLQAIREIEEEAENSYISNSYAK